MIEKENTIFTEINILSFMCSGSKMKSPESAKIISHGNIIFEGEKENLISCSGGSTFCILRKSFKIAENEYVAIVNIDSGYLG